MSYKNTKIRFNSFFSLVFFSLIFVKYMFFGLVFYEIIIVYKTEFREFTLFLFYGGMYFFCLASNN
jgi:hypothetical protein